jgi:GTP-binding protein
MIDGIEGITAQDAHIAGYVHEAAKGIVLVVNKWDLVRERRRQMEEARNIEIASSLVPGELPRAPSQREIEELDAKEYTRQLRAALKFLPYAPIVFAAAKTGYHVGPILNHALRIYDTRQIRVPTAKLNEVVKDAVQRHHPTYVLGRVLRIYYVTQAEVSPPTFVFFVNDPELLHFTYERYLENRLREVFGFEGTAIRLQFRAREKDDRDEERHERRRPTRSSTTRRR